MLPWHFINNLKGKLGDYGGKLVTPLPNFAIHYEEEGYQWILEQRVLGF